MKLLYCFPSCLWKLGLNGGGTFPEPSGLCYWNCLCPHESTDKPSRLHCLHTVSFRDSAHSMPM